MLIPTWRGLAVLPRVEGVRRIREAKGERRPGPAADVAGVEEARPGTAAGVAGVEAPDINAVCGPATGIVARCSALAAGITAGALGAGVCASRCPEAAVVVTTAALPCSD